MTNDNNNTMITKDLVLSYLRPRKIKLWLSPYHNGNRESSSQQPNGELNRLAHEICMELRIVDSVHAGGNSIPPVLKNVVQSQASATVYSILLELQSHAVQKLKIRRCVCIFGGAMSRQRFKHVVKTACNLLL